MSGASRGMRTAAQGTNGASLEVGWASLASPGAFRDLPGAPLRLPRAAVGANGAPPGSIASSLDAWCATLVLTSAEFLSRTRALRAPRDARLSRRASFLRHASALSVRGGSLESTSEALGRESGAVRLILAPLLLRGCASGVSGAASHNPRGAQVRTWEAPHQCREAQVRRREAVATERAALAAPWNTRLPPIAAVLPRRAALAAAGAPLPLRNASQRTPRAPLAARGRGLFVPRASLPGSRRAPSSTCAARRSPKGALPSRPACLSATRASLPWSRAALP
jgi:hypothetical protein